MRPSCAARGSPLREPTSSQREVTENLVQGKKLAKPVKKEDIAEYKMLMDDVRLKIEQNY